MDVGKILRTGYFDNIRVTGILKPLYDSTGILLNQNASFKESIEQSNESFKNGVAELDIQLVGESYTNTSFSDLSHMRDDRESCGLVQLRGTTYLDRYMIASARILILKSDYAIPYKIKSNGKTEKDIEKLAKTSDMLEIMLASLDLCNYTADSRGYSKDYINIAIIDKVYVNKVFRRSGISTWLHNNITDIINMFALVFPTGIILSYGDFANEAQEVFGMTQNEYNKFLYNYYRKLGYNQINKLELPNSVGCSNILYKLFV